MKLYVPSHLRNIPVLDMLCRMISLYSSTYYEDYYSSFDDFYNFYIKIDPIKRFLNLVLSKERFGNISEEEYEEYINYLATLFYSVKGTVRIFDYIIKYLVSEDTFTIDPDTFFYNTSSLNIDISLRDTKLNGNLFYGCLVDFLDSLLYYNKEMSNINVKDLELVVGDEIKAYIGRNVTNYLEFDVKNKKR